ncbi:MAG: hypothetical protein ACRD2O_02145 [Terriglobia bacterium]
MARATKNQGRVNDVTAPEAVFPAAVIPAGVTVAKQIYDNWKEGKPQVKPSEPLVFAVLDSVSQADKHTLTVLCENLGVHGVYVDNFLMTDPKGVGIRAKVIQLRDTIREPQGGPTFDSGAPAAKKSNSLIVLIPPDKKAGFEVEFGRFSPERMEKKPFGKFEVHYTVLGVAEKDLKTPVEFSVRP